MPHFFKAHALAFAALLLLSACGDKTPSGSSGASAPAAAQNPMDITISAEQASNYQTGAVSSAMVSVTQEHPARVEANERLVTRIGASVTGRVTEVLAEVGDTVSAGQTLAYVSSPELTTAQLAFLRAAANQSLAERAVDRARQLIQADVIGSAELQRRETELSISKAELRAAEDQLQIMGLPASAIDKLKTQGKLHTQANITARLSGVVLERKVSQGQVVQPGDQLFTVAELSNVWVVGALPEQAARTVQRGQKVDIIVPAIEQQLTGKVVFVSDTIQPETRTVAIRTQLDNPGRELKPQMLATLRIAANPTLMVVVPEGAVVREGDRDHVFVQTEPNTFRLTPVVLGAAVNKQRPVLKGLDEGATVVVQGAFHLNNDRNQRLLTQPAPAKPGGKS
jgi:cobalt-zinc-cadmium efflux system membrane fusion protein